MKRIILFLLITFNSLQAQFAPEWIARTYWGSPGGTTASTMILDDSLNLYVTGCGGGVYATAKYNSSGAEVWRKTSFGNQMYNLTALSIALDADGNIYITGKSYTLGGTNSTLTVKYSNAGIEQWARKFDANPSSTFEELGSAVAVDNSGNILVSGYSYGILLNGSTYNNIYYIIKYSPQGDSIRVIRIPYPGFSGFEPAMTLDSLDNFYFVCMNDSANNKDYKLYTTKYDSSGNVIWSSGYNVFSPSSFNLTIDKSFNAYITFNDNGIITLKYDRNGILKWAANSLGAQIPIGVEVDDQGNVYGAGTTNASQPNLRDYFTYKLNPDGGLLWSHFFNGVRNLYDQAKSIALDRSGNVYVNGTAFMAQDSTPDYCTLKYDSSGNLMGVAPYDGPGHSYDRSTKVITDKFNNVYVTGASKGSTFDYTTIKYSSFTSIQNTIYEAPKKYTLNQNYPNPFNPVTNLGFGISDFGFVSLKIFDALGSEVATLINEVKNPGSYSVQFDGANFPTGIYFYKLTTGSFSEVKKMILIK